jgi:4-amino-4-deoxy-L-arabinose transferase-like glycosyltransferase
MNKKTYALLFVILIIASFARLYQIGKLHPGLYPDEAMNGNNALEAVKTGDYKIFYPENNGREGLFINIQAGFIKVFGNKPWVLRLPSAIFGILTVLGVFYLAKELFSSARVGLISSFILAVNFWHINFSRMGFRAIMAPLLLVWGMYFLLLSIRKWDLNQRASVAIALLAGGIYGLGFHTYIAYRATPLLLLLLIPFFKNKSGFWKLTASFILGTAVAALPIGLYFLKNPADFLGRTTQVSIFAGGSPIKDITLNTLKTVGMFFFNGDWNWRHNFAGRAELFWPAALLFGFGIIFSLRKVFSKNFRNDGFPFAMLLGWFIVCSLPVIVSNEGIPHALRSILLIPPAVILAGFAGSFIYEKLAFISILAKNPQKYTRVLRLFINTLLLLLFVEGISTYFLLWAKNPKTAEAFNSNYVEIGERLNNIPNETPKYVLVKAGGVLVRGLPMPTQTVMFITDTYLPENQKAKNFHYVTDPKEIPPGAYTEIID